MFCKAKYRWLMIWFSLISDVWSTDGIFTDVVEIGQGQMRGLRSVSGQNRFYGIPYALSTRFQVIVDAVFCDNNLTTCSLPKEPPQDPPKWDGVFNAINRLSSCAQTVYVIPNGSEDCLHLDVYAPENVTPGQNLPVIMFLHGGAYYYGSKLHYDPEFLVTKNTIAVIINYRVGVLGFLCLNGVANLGLKDQVAALKWIKKNIYAFGGDPDNVTICGQSAGASSAAMHFLSPSSKGLFHKAILLSGTPLSPWAFNVEPLRPAFEDAKKLGEVETADDVLRVFQDAPIRDLLSATQANSIDTRYFKYSPCIETNSTDPFFPAKPYDLLKSGQFNKVPMIIGYTDVEGILFYGLHNRRTLKEFDENFLKKLPSVFNWCSDNDRKRISEKIRRHYFGYKPITAASVKGVVNYYSDWIAYSSIDAFSKLMTEFSDQLVYNYVFSYEGGRNFAKFIFGSRISVDGASHSDDIFYIFKPAGLSLLLSNRDKRFIDRLTTMLTNFMKTGNPTPTRTQLLPFTWQPSTFNQSQTLRLQLRPVMETPEPRGSYMLGLLCRYGLRGYVPCDSRQMCHVGKDWAEMYGD